MNEQVQQFEANAKDQMDQMSQSGETVSSGMKTIFEETASYSKRSMENTASFMQNILTQRSFEAVMQLQSDFAQTQMQEFMGQVQKMSKIYQDMGKASFAPVESAIAKSKDAMHG